MDYKMALCPISGTIMEEPVCINGNHYDKYNLLEYLEGLKHQLKHSNEEVNEALKD